MVNERRSRFCSKHLNRNRTIDLALDRLYMPVNVTVIAREKVARLAAVFVLPHPRATTHDPIGLPDETLVSGHPSDVTHENWHD